ncbi:MAG: retention module-containing protein [Gammaproteobacteria bacterium]|nr:MAG: retention module-containing protein [Gammaproteobacteria bacterium]
MANSVATVAALEGQAWAKEADGKLRPLKVGDTVTAEETIITATGAHIELDFGDGHPVTIAGNQEVLMNRDLWTDLASDKQDAAVDNASVQEALTVLNNGGDLTTQLDETAAGLGGGGGNEGHDFVELTRIIEEVNPSSFTYGIDAAPVAAPQFLASESSSNSAPQVGPQSFDGNEDTPISGQILANDPENNPLTYTLTGQPANGALTLDPVTGVFVYTPNANYNGPDSFVVTVTDSRGNTTTTTVGLTVASVNDVPVVADQTLSTTEDAAVAGQVVASDVDGDTLSYAISTVAAHGTVTVNATTGAFVYTPNPNYNGADSFVVTVADGNGGTTTSTISIGVTPVNDAPASANQTLVVDEDTPLTGQVVATDVDGDALAYQVTTAATHGQVTLNAATGAFVYTPNANYNGADTFTVTISDGKGGTTTSLISVGVNPVNDAPVANNPALTTNEDTPVTGKVIASDVDGDTLTYNLVAQPANGTVVLDSATGQFTYTPNSNYNGNESFQVTVNDGKGGLVTSTVSVAVASVNDLPTTNTLAVTLDEDSVQTINLSGADSDGTLTGFVINTLPANGILYSDAGLTQPITAGATVTGPVYFAPTANWNGSTSFSYSAVDNQGGVDPTPAQVNLTVSPVNDAPVANPDLASTPINQSISVDVLANDVDVDDAKSTLVVSNPTVDPVQGTAVIDAQGKVVFTPAANFTGPATVTYTVTDPSGLSSTSTLTVNVGTNTLPASTDKAVNIDEDTSYSFTASDFAFSDADAGQTLSAVRIDSLPTAGSLVLNNVAVVVGQVINVSDIGNLKFEPVANANGANYATFTFSVQDSAGGFDAIPNTISVSVTPVNDAPVAQPAAFTVAEDAPIVNGFVTSTDADATATATYSLNGVAPAGFTFNPNGTYSFDASNSAYQSLGVGQSTVLTIPYTVTDDQGATSTANLVITVTGTDDLPVISTGAGTVVEDTNPSATGTLTATDVDNSSLAFVPSTTSGNYGSLVLTSGGVWTYTLDARAQALAGSETKTENFTVTLTDGSTTTVTVGITGTDDLPVISTGAGTVVEDTSPSAIGTLTADDIDNASLAFVPSTTSGNYGSLVLTADGVWTYTLDARADVLAGGETKSESFTVTLTDGSTTTVNIGITGTNDAPVAVADVASTAINSALSNISVLGNDTDVDGGSLSVTSAVLVNPTLGTVTINPNGTLNFTPAVNVTGPIVIHYEISDGQGGTSAADLTVNVGANTPPTGSDLAVTINEDGSKTFSAPDFGFADSDSGQTLLAVRIDSLPTAGSLTLNGSAVGVNQIISAGDLSSLVFTPADNANGTNYANFNFSVQDSAGSFSTASSTITVNVTADDDASVLVADTKTIDEDDVATGNVLTNDSDIDNTLSVASFHVAGDATVFTAGQTATITGVGTFNLAADGAYTFTPNANWNGSVPTVTYITNTGSSTTLNITVDPLNDAPVANNDSAAVLEDATLSVPSTSGVLINDTDVDGDALVVSQVNGNAANVGIGVVGTYGTITLNANGSYTYAANNANSLAAGVTATDSFSYQVSDGHGGTSTATVTITITGTNDAAIVSSANVVLTETDAPLTTSGILTSTDVDNAANAFTPSTTVGATGTLTIDAQGHWTYVANSAFDNLNLGQNVNETFTVASVDGTTSTIKITINGTNDAATVSSANVALDETNSPLTTSGTLTSVDVDNAANTFTPSTTVGTTGTLSIDVNGHWNYVANSAFDNLNVGQNVNETFTVASVDGTTSIIKITINGTNDAATVSSANVVLTETNAPLTTSGTLTSTDVDNAANTFTPSTTVGTTGTLSIDVDGHWNYVANSAFDNLNVGQNVNETFTVASVDGTASTITITITGTNDAAVIGGVNSAALTETNAIQSTSGALTVSDVDSPAVFIAQTNAAGSNGYGKFNLGTDGVWTYTMNTAHNEFVGGQTYTDSLTVSSADGTTSIITVSILGTNDAAVIGGVSIGAITETNAIQTTSGTLTVSDVDSSATFIAQTNVAGSNGYGHFTLDTGGVWTYTMDTAHNEFVGGQTYTDSLTVSSADGTTSTVTVTITGTNDAAIITGTNTASLTETNAIQSTGGTLNVTDVDSPAAFVAQTNAAGSNGYGKFNLGTDGVWTYTMNTAHNEFVGGQTYTDSLTVSSADGTTSTITVSILGTNDAAVIGGVSTATLTETNSIQSTGGTLTVSDADSTAGFVAQSNAAGSNGYGKFNLGTDGVWTYTMNTAHNEFVGGQTYTDSLTVSSADGTTSVITVTINGTNDAAVITPAVANLIETNAILTTGGTLAISDVDSPATFLAQNNVAGSNGYGHFTLDTGGVWSYTTDTAHNEFAAGTTYTDSLTVTSADGTTSTITVNIAGTNDAAVITGTSTASLTETNAIQSTGGTLIVNDVDSPATFVAQTNVAGSNGYGKFTLGGDGVWTYTMNTAHDEFVAGQTYTDSLSVSSADGTTSTITVSILGTNDAAVITPAVANLTETNAILSTGGTLAISDVDSSATFVAQTNVAGNNGYGHFTLGTDGVWTYTTDPAHNEFAAGTTYTDSLTVTSADGTTSTITINIAGTNDAAVISGTSTAGLTETNAIQSTGGTLTVTDVDSPAVFIAQTNAAGSNGYGKFTLGANGVWTYTMNTAHDEFVAGQTYTDSLTVSSADGTTSTITVSILGTNDAAVITPPVASLTETNAILSTGGTVVISDVDSAVTFVAQSNVAGSNGYGHFNITTNGVWTYTTDTAHNEFAAGTTYTDKLTITSADGTTSTITVNIQGTNDAPIATPANFIGAAAATSIPVTLAGTDVDGSVVSIKVTTLPTVAQGVLYLADGTTAVTTSMNLTVSQAATLKFVPKAGFDGGLDIPFTVTDNNGAVSTPANAHVVVNAVNDAPVAVDDPATGSTLNKGLLSQYYSYHEGPDGANLTTLAQINAFIAGKEPTATFIATSFNYGADNLFSNDLGHGTNLQAFLGADAATLSTDPADSSDAIIRMYGSVELAAGSYNFKIRGDDGYQIKVDGVAVATVDQIQSPTGTTHAQFTITTGGLHSIEILYWDQGGQAVFKVELSGDNGVTYNLLSSVPTYYSAVHAMNEDTSWTVAGSELLANDSDIDGDTLSIISVQNPINGTVVLNADGSVTFTPTANYNGLATYTYTISDGHGGTDTATVTMNILPVNDLAVVSNVSANGGGITFTASDVDVGTTLALTPQFAAAFGNPTINNGTATTLSAVEQATAITGVLKVTDATAPVDVITLSLGTSGNNTFDASTNTTRTALYGFGGDDVLIGGSGNDTLVGGTGNDTLTGGAGNDALIGDSGDDTFKFGLSDGTDSIDDSSGNDAIVIAANGAALTSLDFADSSTTAAAGNLTISLNGQTINVLNHFVAATTVETITFTGGATYKGYSLANTAYTLSNDDSGTRDAVVGANTILIGDTAANTLVGSTGNDLLFGGAGNDTLKGDAGNDLLVGGAGTDTLTGGAGTDTFYVDAGVDVITDLSVGGVADNLVVTTGAAASATVAGNFIATAGTINDGTATLNTNNGFSVDLSQAGGSVGYTINNIASTTGANLTGSNFADTLRGGTGIAADTLNGGGGNDTLTGGKGNDTLTGGTGADTFVWNLVDKGTTAAPAKDTVTDFNTAAGDKLDLHDLLQGETNSTLTNYLHFTSDGTNTTVSISSAGAFTGSNYGTATDQTIVLSGVNLTGGDAAIINLLKTNSNLITD